MGVGAMVLYRFLFATLVLLPLLFTHRPSFDRREWGTLLFCAFLGVPLQFLIQFSGLNRTTVSHASLMVGTMPVLLAVAATLFARERMDATGWFALVVSTIRAAPLPLGARPRSPRERMAAPGWSPLVVPPIGPPLTALGARHSSAHPGGPAGPTLAGDLLVALPLVIPLGWVLIGLEDRRGRKE